MSEFDKHWDTHCISSNCEEDEAKIHFEAGQQSKQAEIDRIVGIITEAYKSDGNSSLEIAHNEILELLK